ncbi:prepilin-type N-terminal cleavage/methylation domain-containing protein [bacterium]|nr:prepilin-type N-terminal cleavage/methylation domain-containing protein [bacterium]
MRPRSLDLRRAFTLIELLIVVPIIAILAAIAVPNFLHAQIRARVASVLADMANLGIAVEAYMADYDHYPPSRTVLPDGTPASGIFAGRRLYLCTTPVAYIARVPLDPFSQDPNLGPNGTRIRRDALEYLWQNLVVWAQNDGTIYIDYTWQRRWQVFSGVTFWHSTYSYGPDKDYQAQWREPTYDPSNGIISDGDIYMLGPGNYFIKKEPGMAI